MHDPLVPTRESWHGYADAEHPFRFQGAAKLNTYKMFLEQAHALLRPAGRLGLIVPSGVYTDKGSSDLRRLFLEDSDWRWLFGFENRWKIFDIDSRFKFAPVIVAKGGRTDAVRAAFMRHDLADWEEAEWHAVPYRREQVERFSPRTLAILEVRTRRDLEVLEKIYANSVLLGDDGSDGWGIKYAQSDFHMTNDSKLFPPRPWWEAKGYRPDEYGRWVGPEEDVALPLWQGVMIGPLRFNRVAYVGGRGLGAKWTTLEPADARLTPQFLMGLDDALAKVPPGTSSRAAFRPIARTTDARTMIAALIPGWPAGNSLGLVTGSNTVSTTILAAVLASFVFDSQLRTRQGGSNINYHVLSECALPATVRWLKRSRSSLTTILPAVHALACTHPVFGPAIVQANPLRILRLALTPHERLRLRCMLDAVVAELYGLDWSDLAYILRDCDHPAERMRQSGFSRGLDPKGFWRVDKGQDPELRHTMLTLAAFQDLKDTIARVGSRERGIAAFTQQHDGDGWMVPDTLCLADLGLGHDERARKPQPLRARLGERFLPWQLEQTPEESWAECERHARNLLGETEFRRLQRELAAEEREERRVAEEPGEYRVDRQPGLWDDEGGGS